MRRKRPDGWMWAAGGLDLNAKSLGELRATEVPTARPPTALRLFFEGRGYKVRCSKNIQWQEAGSKGGYRGKRARENSVCSQNPCPRRVRKSVKKKVVWFSSSSMELTHRSIFLS